MQQDARRKGDIAERGLATRRRRRLLLRLDGRQTARYMSRIENGMFVINISRRLNGVSNV